MRIAEINDVASVASELANGLRARGHDVALFQPRLFGGHLPNALKPFVAPVRVYEWARLLRGLRAGHFDILHIHYAYLGMLGVLARRPFLLHCHGSDVWGLTPFTRPLASRALKSAGHVFYATPDLAPHTLRFRPDAEFLPNPIDWRTFEPSMPPSAGSGVYVCCALDDLKGAPVILDACRRLATARPDIKVTAIAGAKYTPDFVALPNVTLLPFQRRADLPVLVGRHAVVIGQMNLGAAGMAELESMSCARPVVHKFNFGGAYAEPPPFVRATTGEEIAAAVIRLIDAPQLRAELGQAGRDWIKRHHDIDAMAGRVEQVALDVLRRREAECAHAS